MQDFSRKIFKSVLLALFFVNFGVGLVFQPRILAGEKTRITEKYEGLGTKGFVASLFLKKFLSKSEGTNDPHYLNKLFFEVVNRKQSKVLELMLIYMKTFQKDFLNKCKMAIRHRVDIVNSDDTEKIFYFSRCEFLTKVAFKYQHTSLMFFNIESIFRSFLVLLETKEIKMEFEDEDEAKRDVRNEVFLNVLGNTINEAAKNQNNEEEISFVAEHFDLMNQFYGAHFLKLFSSILDEEFNIKRYPILVNEEQQQLMDWGFGVNQETVKTEKNRVQEKKTFYGILEDNFIDKTPETLYRYYKEYFWIPFFNVGEYHMF